MFLIKHIEREFGLSAKHLKRIKRAFKVTVKGGGSLCLKPFKIPRQEVRFIVNVHRHLRNRGYPYSPKLRMTRNGQSWTWHNHTHYLLTNWVHGRSPNFHHPASVTKGIRALASFHRYSEGLRIQQVPARRMPILHLRQYITSSKAFIRKRVASTQSKPFLELCDRALQYISGADAKRAIQREIKARAFVHGDYNYHNIVVDSSGHYHLIDFEKTALQVRMYDLAHVMYRICPWNGDRASRLIEVYNRTRPLSREDLRLLVALLCIPGSLIRSIHWGGKRDIPSPLRLKQYVTWLRKTYG